jgi:hypothetical protein
VTSTPGEPASGGPEETDPELPFEGHEPSPEPASEPAWRQPEVAWALAILAGFVGASVGLYTRQPGLPEALSTAAFVPLFLALLERRGALLVGLLGLGWGVGIAGAVVGAVLDERSAMVRAALPLGRAYAALALDPYLGGGAQEGQALGSILGLAWIAASLLGSLATRGVLGHLCVAVGLGAVSGATADWALRAVQAGAEPILASLLCFPPCALVALAGVILASAAVVRGRLPAAPEERAHCRILLLVGLAAAVLALVVEPWVAPHWAHAVRRALPI